MSSASASAAAARPAYPKARDVNASNLPPVVFKKNPDNKRTNGWMSSAVCLRLGHKGELASTNTGLLAPKDGAAYQKLAIHVPNDDDWSALTSIDEHLRAAGRSSTDDSEPATKKRVKGKDVRANYMSMLSDEEGYPRAVWVRVYAAGADHPKAIPLVVRVFRRTEGKDSTELEPTAAELADPSNWCESTLDALSRGSKLVAELDVGRMWVANSNYGATPVVRSLYIVQCAESVGSAGGGCTVAAIMD